MELSFKKILLHLGLFIATFVTTTLAGAEFVYSKSIFIVVDDAPAINTNFSWGDFTLGMHYSIPFLLILTVHEFGHYFVAVYYKVRTTLPYYIPFPFFLLGTMGAVIRLKSVVRTKQQNFDIGVAGPLAGFVVAVAVLWYGFATLPPIDYIFQFHPEYQKYGADFASQAYAAENIKVPIIDITLGKNLLFMFFENFVADPSRVPNAHELMHYPYLLAGFWALVFTSLNLLPIGQLDGGHVLYGFLGFRGHRKVASAAFIGLLFYSGLGVVVPGQSIDLFGEIPYPLTIPFFIGFLYLALGGLKWDWKNQLMTAVIIFSAQYFTVILFPSIQGYSGWLLFALLIGRVIGVMHPPSEIETPLTPGRKVLGVIAIIVFILCITPAPIEMTTLTPVAP